MARKANLIREWPDVRLDRARSMRKFLNANNRVWRMTQQGLENDSAGFVE